MANSPVLIFTYKRLAPLKKCINGLLSNVGSSETDVFIFSDGPKNDVDRKNVEDVRSYIDSVVGFKNIYVIHRQVNFGLARSIIEGTSEVLKKYDTVVVLEDDLVPTANFLRYLNESLDIYRNSREVFSVSAFSFNIDPPVDYQYDSYFLNRGWSWGWATWRDRWEGVDWEVKDYQHFIKDKKRRREFNRGGSDLTSMLKKQMNGDLDSWAIRWFYHQFKLKGLTLYPVKSKVLNIGFDQDATHTTGSSKRYIPNLDSGVNLDFQFPSKIEINDFFQKRFQSKMGIPARIISKLTSIYLKLKR